MTKTIRRPLSPEDLYYRAVTECDGPLSAAELRLLKSGLAALRERANPINAIERKAVIAMISYAAYSKHVSEDVVRRVIATNLGIHEIDAMPATRWQDVMDFLVDMPLEKATN